jgi:hypothetical protein
MPRTRKNHPPSLKAKIAVEVIKGHKTAAEIAQIAVPAISESLLLYRPPLPQ